MSVSQIIHAQDIWTLQRCLDTAKVNNHRLKISQNLKQISQAKHQEANANWLPKLIANADYKYFTDLPYQMLPLSTFNPAAPEGQFKAAQFGVPHNLSANLQLTIPLYNPQIHGATQTTKVAQTLTEQQYQKTEEQILIEVTNAYYNAQILYHQLAFIDSNIVNTKKLLQNTKLLHEQLLAKNTDVNKVQLQLDLLITQQENIKSKYLQTLNLLKLSMGFPMEKDIRINTDIQYKQAQEYTTAQAIDITIAKQQQELLASELNTLKFSRLPSLSLFANYGTTGFGYDKAPNIFFKFYPIGFAGILFSYPLFNGTVTQQKIKQKKLELENSQLQIDWLKNQNAIQISNLQMQRNIAQQTITNNKENIKLAETIYQQTLTQQKQGTASLTEVLLAYNALQKAQQDYLSAIVDYLKADLELKYLTGNFNNTTY